MCIFIGLFTINFLPTKSILLFWGKFLPELKSILKSYVSETYPQVKPIPVSKVVAYPEVIKLDTKHEGPVTYVRFWNFFVRHGVSAKNLSVGNNMFTFFHNYESTITSVQNMIQSIGVPESYPPSEEEVWTRISTVWTWYGNNVKHDNNEYSKIIPGTTRWPSIEEFAQYYSTNKKLAVAACFSSAHLFAILLGRTLPRWCLAIVDAHHTENGAPPTSSHVYVIVYLTGKWYYLDPTAAYAGYGPLPEFKNRKSVGLFKTVDYEHPWSAIPLPKSPFDKVPFVPS